MVSVSRERRRQEVRRSHPPPAPPPPLCAPELCEGVWRLSGGGLHSLPSEVCAAAAVPLHVRISG